MRAHIAATSRPSTCAVRSPRRAVAPKPRAAAKGVQRVQPPGADDLRALGRSIRGQPQRGLFRSCHQEPGSEGLALRYSLGRIRGKELHDFARRGQGPHYVYERGGGAPCSPSEGAALDGLLHHSNVVAARGNVGQALRAETARLLTESASGRVLRGQRREIKAPLKDVLEAELHVRAAPLLSAASGFLLETGLE